MKAIAWHVRDAREGDAGAVRAIYNEGIADRIATLEMVEKSAAEMAEWFALHDERYAVLVAEAPDGVVVGWASINRYSHRCVYDAVVDLSVYVARTARGRGVGTALLAAIDRRAAAGGFRKIVLLALAANENGLRLYRGSGYREVGIYREHGMLEGRLVDVVAMEKLLP